MRIRIRTEMSRIRNTGLFSERHTSLFTSEYSQLEFFKPPKKQIHCRITFIIVHIVVIIETLIAGICFRIFCCSPLRCLW